MKHLILCLFFPLFLFGQTGHHDEEKILYKDTVKLAENRGDVFNRLLQVFPNVAGKLADSIRIVEKDDELEALASIRLKSPYAIIKKLHFTMTLHPVANGYAYTVDSVFVTEKRRGWKEKKKDSKEMIEALEETGNAAIELEILLNEIDLRIQQLLTILEKEMRKTAVVGKQKGTAFSGKRS
jgi:hypothetical protein